MSDRIAGRLPDGTPVTFDEAGLVAPVTITFNARPQFPNAAEMAAAVKRALEAPKRPLEMGHRGAYRLAVAVLHGEMAESVAMSYRDWPEAEVILKRWNENARRAAAMGPRTPERQAETRRWAQEMEPDPADQRIIAWMPTEYMEAARAGQGKPDALEVAQLAGYLKVGDVVRVKDLGPTMLELFPCTCADCADASEAPIEPDAFGGADLSMWAQMVAMVDRQALEAMGVPHIVMGLPGLPACPCEGCKAKRLSADAPEAKPEPESGVWLISPSTLPMRMRNGAQDGKGKAKGRAMVYDFDEVP